MPANNTPVEENKYIPIKKRSSGGLSSFKVPIPILFLLEPKNLPYAIDLNDFEKLKLWAISYIDEFYLTTDKPPNDDEESWVATWDPSYCTNFEGCLALRKKERPYAPPSITKNKFFIHFTTIPIDSSDIQSVCGKFGIKLELTPKEKHEVKRPYPEDVPGYIFTLNWPRGKTVPSSLSQYVKYHPEIKLLTCEKELTESEKKTLKGITDDEAYKKDIDRLCKNLKNKKFNGKVFVVQVPESSIQPAGKIEKLDYWEKVMYKESSDKRFNEFKELWRKRQLNKADFEKLRGMLRDMRGTFIHKMINFEDSPNTPKDFKLPLWVCDERTNLNDKRLPVIEGGRQRGPYWYYSEFEQTLKKGDLNKSEEGASEDEDEADDESEEIKNGTFLFKLDSRAQDKFGGGNYTLPKPFQFLPPVNDKIINDISSGTRKLFLDQKKDSDKILNKIKQNFEKIKGPNLTKYKNLSNFFTKFFKITTANDLNGAIFLALDEISKEFSEVLTISQMEDYMVGSTKKTKVSIPINLIVGFSTLSDAFSESPTPKHVYQQLKEWWDNLWQGEKEKILSSAEIVIRGFSSELGTENINKNLRKNRAWKIAKSLELVLKKPLEDEKNKVLSLVPYEKSKIGIEVETPNIPKNAIPIYHYAAPEGAFPKEHPYLFHPSNSTLCEVLEDDSIVKKAVKQVPENNSPRDRIGIITFYRNYNLQETQEIEQKVKVSSAIPISGYRVIHHDKSYESGLHRILIYVIPGFWK